jgi:hypothetical protein
LRARLSGAVIPHGPRGFYTRSISMSARIFDWNIGHHADEAVFRRPPLERLWFNILAMVALGTAWHFGLFRPDRDYGWLSPITSAFVVFVFAFCGGPKETRFDFSRRHFRIRCGILFFSWTRTGGAEEIASLRAYSATLKRSAVVDIIWRRGILGATHLAECSTDEEARQRAQEIAARMGVKAEVSRQGQVQELTGPTR